MNARVGRLIWSRPWGVWTAQLTGGYCHCLFCIYYVLETDTYHPKQTNLNVSNTNWLVLYETAIKIHSVGFLILVIGLMSALPLRAFCYFWDRACTKIRVNSQYWWVYIKLLNTVNVSQNAEILPQLNNVQYSTYIVLNDSSVFFLGWLGILKSIHGYIRCIRISIVDPLASGRHSIILVPLKWL